MDVTELIRENLADEFVVNIERNLKEKFMEMLRKLERSNFEPDHTLKLVVLLAISNYISGSVRYGAQVVQRIRSLPCLSAGVSAFKTSCEREGVSEMKERIARIFIAG